MEIYDVIVIGAGASGLTAAGVLVARGKRVAVIDMGARPARKVAVSGGGRCNFTNIAVAHNRYVGENPDFVRGAIARTTPTDILEWAAQHGIDFVEKSPGQYFCVHGAAQMVNALGRDACGADIITNTMVHSVTKENDIFTVNTDIKTYMAAAVIVATGGISFPTLGVSDIGYKIARHFGHKTVPPQPGLCGLVTKYFPPELSGISIPARISVGNAHITDGLLLTHFGIGGPAAYRASLYDLKNGIYLNLMPDTDVFKLLCDGRRTMAKKTLPGVLETRLPARLARWIANGATKNMADYSDAEIRAISATIEKIFIPGDQIARHGMAGAEVVRGGVSTADISSKTMESKLCPGLFFAGEVLDVAGDLGGFNLHWAWASGRAAGANA